MKKFILTLGLTTVLLPFTAIAKEDLATNVKVQASDKGNKMEEELKIEDTIVGTGVEAKPGQMIEVHYTGKLTNGTVFDSSLNRNETFKFKLGAGQVIKGWDQGFAGMKVGGKRTLTIPASLGYGSRGAGAVIPPNATLIFDVELINVG